MSKKSKAKKTVKKILVVIAIVLLFTFLCFIGYFIYSYYNSLKAEQNLLSQASLSSHYRYQDTSTDISLISKNPNGIGVIVYPGAFAEPEGYVAVFKDLAVEGFSVFIDKSPLNFALLEVDSASKIIKQNPQISKWYVAGHSLGGVAACEYAKTNQSKIKGLILLASFCNGDAKNINLPVLSVSASRDGLTDTKDVENSRSKLPASAQFVVIEGGNHTQFGAFQKLQPGDNTAQIKQSEQISQTTNAIIQFLK